MRIRALIFFPLLYAASCLGADNEPVISTGYHLTARPWQPLKIPRERYLDAIEGDCRFTAKQQDASGAVIDPFLKREHQYSTPYFAYAVGVLVEAGRAKEGGFHSVLGRVEGSVYMGRNSAGGIGDRLDIAGHGTADVKFDRVCGFVIQLRNGKALAVEADRDVQGEIQGQKVKLRRYQPFTL